MASIVLDQIGFLSAAPVTDEVVQTRSIVNDMEPMIAHPLLLLMIALVLSIAALVFVLRTSRQTRRIWEELERQRVVGMDAWIAEQVRRWVDGELRSKTEKGIHVDTEVIEPIPGWRITVGTMEHGKRIPFHKMENDSQKATCKAGAD